MDPLQLIGYEAVRRGQERLRSALPGAPTRDQRPEPGGMRRALARTLRRIADRLAPAEAAPSVIAPPRPSWLITDRCQTQQCGV